MYVTPVALLLVLSRLTLSTWELGRSSKFGTWRNAGRMFTFGDALEYM